MTPEAKDKTYKVFLHFKFNILQPSGFFTYHKVEHSKILHCVRFALSVLY